MDGKATSATLRRRAVDDVLKYLRDPGHQLRDGWALAPLLLGEAAQQATDEARLALRLEEVLRLQLEQWRIWVGAPLPATPLTPAEVLHHDRATHNSHLELWSLLWAYYIRQLSKAELARIYALKVRRIEQKLQAGREMLCAVLARPELLPPPGETTG